jgi:type IV fimbrial biogenesis protein FimT
MNKHQSGFTLTEMLVVTAIVSVLLGIAIPSYKFVTTSYRLSAELNNLSGDLQYARAEAIKEGNGATVCVSANGVACTGGGNWNVGWIVFSDINGDAAVDGNDRVLRVQGAFNGTTPDNAVGATSFTFNREGFGTTAGVGYATTLVTFSDPVSGNSTYTRCLSVNNVGTVTALTHVTSPGSC